MSLRRYGSYRESGVEWLGKLPDHWKVERLKRLCDVRPSNVDKKSYDGQEQVRICNYTDVYYGEQITPALELMEATATAEQIERFGLRAGDVIVTKDSETADDIAISAHVPATMPGVVCGYHLALLRPQARVEGAFIKRFFDSHFAKASVAVRANGLTRVGLGQYALDNLLVPTPPELEQRAIAVFLDRETAKIDALVEEQCRLIELLKEKRQAVISHAITKGLDPTAPIKDSGVEWLGPVPSHWTMKRLKHLSPSITVGIVVNPSEYVSDEGLPFLYGADIKEGQIEWETARRIAPEVSASQGKTALRAGDLVTVRVGAPGVTAVIPPQCEGGNCASVMLVRQGPWPSEWLSYAMNSRVVRFQVEVVQYGAAQEQFNISHALNFLVPTPPLEEAKQIASVLRRATEKIDTLLGGAADCVSLLQERRAALISAAVTGKIDVRESAATPAKLEPA
ncbi:hypothetical protein [Phenylobacterium sp.]|uniref:hypothetical protein n=1 Tax=Phenylobacterium sp. TaxID=1871053 RepID=UPI0025ED441B|nr:hypothetical protein [Phenylobacterium sp.]